MPKTIHLSAIIAAFLLSFTMVHLALDEAQAAPPIKPEKCDNGRDDDQDGLIDLDDPDCQGGGGSAPSISEVMVDTVSDPNNIAIFGADFDQGDNLTVTLGDEGALTVTEALAGMITAQLPAGVVGGSYSLTVEHSNGSDTFDAAIGVQGEPGVGLPVVVGVNGIEIGYLLTPTVILTPQGLIVDSTLFSVAITPHFPSGGCPNEPAYIREGALANLPTDLPFNHIFKLPPPATGYWIIENKRVNVTVSDFITGGNCQFNTTVTDWHYPMRKVTTEPDGYPFPDQGPYRLK